MMQLSAAFFIFVTALCRTEVVGVAFYLTLDRIFFRDIGATLGILNHVFAAGCFFSGGGGWFQQGLFDDLEYRIHQKADNQPNKSSNKHLGYQVSRTGASSATPELPAASSATVLSSNGCLKSGAISCRGASTKARSWSLGCGMVSRSSQMTWSS